VRYAMKVGSRKILEQKRSPLGIIEELLAKSRISCNASLCHVIEDMADKMLK